MFDKIWNWLEKLDEKYKNSPKMKIAVYITGFVLVIVYLALNAPEKYLAYKKAKEVYYSNEVDSIKTPPIDTAKKMSDSNPLTPKPVKKIADETLFIDDADPRLTYNPNVTWITDRDANTEAQTQHLSADKTARVTLRFSGTFVTVCYYKQKGAGLMGVQIDGQLFEPIDCGTTNEQPIFSQKKTYKGLNNISHRLTLSNMGSGYMVIDGFEVSKKKNLSTSAL